MTLELLMQDNYKNGLAKGLAKGLAEGEKKGEKKAQAQAKKKEAQIVKNFYSKKIPLETISECTGLNISEIQRIIALK